MGWPADAFGRAGLNPALGGIFFVFVLSKAPQQKVGELGFLHKKYRLLATCSLGTTNSVGPCGGTAKSHGRDWAAVCSPSEAAKVRGGLLWAGRWGLWSETVAFRWAVDSGGWRRYLT